MNDGNYNGNNHLVRTPLFREPDVLLLCLGGGAFLILIYIATTRWHISMRQIQEIAAYSLLTLGFCYLLVWQLLTKRRRKDQSWSATSVSRTRDRKNIEESWTQDSVVLGYDPLGKPWLWPDRVRVMQGIVLGQTGSGKTTLLRNIITQDLARRAGPQGDRHKIPMVIFDGKGDLEFFHSLLPHILRAGRLQDLRLLNPARPDISVLYNPFHSDDDNYMAQVNMVFGSFNLHDEFFAKHQLNYLADIVRVLTYTGLRYNFYDVIVMALDEKVLREQADIARKRIECDPSVSTQRWLNFEMSVKNLFQSLQDRERVPKIQGLLNECMTFLDDELSVITGPYEDLLSIEDVIEQGLILFVTLNVNKNTEPVRALGKMLLQNLQLVVGKRYESEEQRRQIDRPLFSVVLDEFAPFGYRNFAQILQTSRGTKTAFLFSMQSLPQLMQVGRGFKEDVTSAPNTTIILRTRDEETASYFIRASAQETVSRRSYNLAQQRLFVHEWYEKTGAATEREDKEYRAKDLDVKTLPKGQMQILMTDDALGVLHSRLHVRAPQEIQVPCFRAGVVSAFAPLACGNAGSQPAFQKSGDRGEGSASAPRKVRSHTMTRFGFVLFVLLLASCPVYSQVSRQRPKRDTWYEQALRHINPENIDFGSIWEQRKREFIAQFGNRYFQYSFGATAAILLLLTVTFVQHVSHKRALELAAQTIADVLRHDEYSRQVAREAIRRYNDHIESCNRVIEARQEGLAKSISATESELQRIREELVDTREENKALREDLAKKSKIIAGMSLPSKAAQAQSAQTEMESAPAQYIARINELEKQLRAEQRRNHRAKETSVDDHRA